LEALVAELIPPTKGIGTIIFFYGSDDPLPTCLEAVLGPMRGQPASILLYGRGNSLLRYYPANRAGGGSFDAFATI
jgi:hypothetical protein